MGELVEATEAVDVPNENPDEDDEKLNAEPNGDLLCCQLEVPNTAEFGPLLELTELAAVEEAEVPSPKVVPELKIFVAELEELNNELPEEKAFVAGLEEGNNELPEEKAVFPVNPNDGDDAAEPNGSDWVWVDVANPLIAGDAWVSSTDPLLAPMTEL